MRSGKSCVYFVVEFGYFDIFEFMIWYKVDFNFIILWVRWYFIYIVVFKGYIEVIDLLLKRVVEFDVCIVDGWIFLWLVVYQGYYEIVKLFLDIKMFIDIEVKCQDR